MTDLNWVPLRLNILPLIHMQTQSVLNMFLNTRTQILEGDILGLQTLYQIRDKVKQRITEIDKFYNLNAIDPRTRYLYSIRALLYQILQGCQEFDKFNEMTQRQAERQQLSILSVGNESQPSNKANRKNLQLQSLQKSNLPQKYQNQKNGRAQNYHLNTTFANVSKMTDKTQTNKSFLGKNKLTPKKGAESQNQLRLSDIQKKSNKSKSPIRRAGEFKQVKQVKKGSSRKVQLGVGRSKHEKGQQLKWLQKQREQASQRYQGGTYDANKSFRDLSELVFTIKMTKQEYNQFMKLKRKNNHA